MSITILNATVIRTTISTERMLSAWLHLDRSDGFSQAFGGYMLYSEKMWNEGNALHGNYGAHFIKRCIDVCGVEEWEKIPGKNIRIKLDSDAMNASIIGIGHIIKDIWFEPKKDFSDFDERNKL